MSNKLIPFLIILLLASLTFYWYNRQQPGKTTAVLKTTVKKGPFRIKINATGELLSRQSEKIMGPQNMRTVGIWQTNITDLVPEGTVVKKGDYVASLDKTELANKIKDAQSEIDKILNQMEQAKIDTAIELRGLRDQLINLTFSKKEKQLQVEQSRYEPQMVIQQAQIDLEKTDREYNQLQKNFQLRQQQAQTKLKDIDNQLKRQQSRLNMMNSLAQEFTVSAPKGGMVIYYRQWGERKGPGSQISSWDPVVAELPDLSEMISRTYVNEVDISKVQKGQEVKIKVDAFPDKSYKGTVVKVANIGEQLKGSDAKVFEVTVNLEQSDSILRPAMTTSNEIITDVYDEALYIPIEALETDSVSFVYKQLPDGNIVKQEVLTGESNNEEIIIVHGLAEGDQVLLGTPPNPEKIPVSLIPPQEKSALRKKYDDAMRERLARRLERQKKVRESDVPKDEKNKGGGRVIIIGD